MLSKKERLSREAFNRFFSMGKRLHSPTFQLVYSPYETLHASVVVPKKVVRLAVKRNKIRRRIYDIVRHSLRDGGGGVYIILVKAGVEGKSYALLKDEVEKAFQNTKRLS